MASIESRLRRALRDGAAADLAADGLDAGLDSTDGAWGELPVVDAGLLLSLLTTDGDSAHPRGLTLRGARLVGDLAWEWQRLRVPLGLERCSIDHDWSLYGANLRGLRMNGCRTAGINARLVTVEGDLRLIDNRFDGSLILTDARLRGSLVMHGSRVGSDSLWQGQPVAILADRVAVGGSLALTNGFKADALVSLHSAQVGGTLFAGGATLLHPGSQALVVAGAHIAGELRLDDGFTAQGEVQADGAVVGQNVCLSRGRFSCPGGEALSLDQAQISGGILMIGATVEGRMRMLNTRVAGNISMDGTVLTNPDGEDALWASNLDVDGNVFLRKGLHVHGRTRMITAHIGRSLVCSDATFDGGAGHAVAAQGARVVGEIDLRNSTVTGVLSLAGATVGASVLLQRARLAATTGPALHLTGATVGGTVDLEEVTASGQLRLDRAQVGVDVNLIGASIRPTPDDDPDDADPPSARALTLAGSTIAARLRCRRMTTSGGMVDLGGASVVELDDDAQSWPPPGALVLANFSFTRIGRQAPRGAAERIDWVRRQASFSPDPYRRLVRLYREAGQADDATDVAIAQQDDLLKASDLRLLERMWRRFLGWSVRHGYRPGRAATALAVVYLLTVGGVALGVTRDAFIQVGNTAPQPGVVVSRCDNRYPCLSVPVYALENIVPIVTFHQADNWQPDASTPEGRALRGWLFLTTMAGYLGSTLLAAAATGLIESKLST